MTLSRKTPMARKAAWSYCRRALAFMLCLVLLSGFAMRTAPRAAAIVDGTSAYEIVGGPNLTVIEGGASGGTSSAASAVTGSTIGAFLLAASGINMMVDSINYSTTRYSGGTVYEEGNELWAYLYDLGGDIADWCISGAPSGSIHPGDTFTVPAEVLEAARAWAVDNFDFIDGVCTYDEHALNDGEGNFFVLSDVDVAQLDTSTSSKYFNCTVRSVGTLVKFHAGDFSEPYEIRDYITDEIYCVSRYTLTEPTTEGGSWSGTIGQRWYLPGFADDTSISAGLGSSVSAASNKEAVVAAFEKDVADQSSFGVLFRSPGTNRLYCGVYTPRNGLARAGARNYCDLGTAALEVFGTTFTKTSALDEPKTEDITITIPQELPTTQVGELTIPVITEITSTDLTEAGGEKDPSTDPQPGTGLTPGQITESIKNALPVTGSQLGDDVLEETLSQPDDIGAVFITKFPFSIPWDIAKAIELLAAPPKTPRFEFDFFGPMDDLVGGFPDDTTIVIDFSEYEIVGIATRWLSTVFFIYALASGTKRLLWTA